MRVLKWPGAKWTLANRLLNIMPDHKIYLEPFFGSGAVFFNKSPVQTEVLNDLDAQVYNLFKVIRERPAELASLVDLTPYSKDEYQDSYEIDPDTDEIEKARKFIVRSNMARAGMQYYSSSWRHAGPVLGARSWQRVTGDWNQVPQRIMDAANRLKYAEIENTDAIKLIQKYNTKDCLIYADPPYLLSTRRQRYYNEEMTKDQEHIELIKALKQHEGPVMLSGYDSELYNDLLPGWVKHEFDCNAEAGKKRIEVVWTNYQQFEQLSII